LALVRACAKVQQAEGYDVVNSRIFEVEKQARPSGTAKQWRRIFHILPPAPRPVKLETLSLLQFLDQRHNAVTYGTPSGGRETVAVPFTHLALLTSANGRLAGGIPAEQCRELEEQIETRFDRSIDPSVNVRVGSAATGALSTGEMIAYIGEGVFVPLENEQPTGRIRVGPSLDALEEPVFLGDRRAGIYRGQSALAFGSSHLVAPATARLELPPGVWFYLEAVAGGTASAQSAAKTIDINARGGHAVKLIEPSDTADVRFCFEFAHDPGGGYADTLYVEVTADERPSRLLREQPRGRPSFEIVAFRISEQDLADGVEAFWFDFDADGFPISSAMIPREATVVYDGRRTRRYSWRRYEYELQPVASHRIASERGAFAFRRNDDLPFGFLEPPSSPLPAVFQSEWWTTRGYHLDWLDFAGCVENALGNRGLAEIHAARGNVIMPSFSTAPDGEFEVGPLTLRRTGGAR
jgi:hypothetical protein